MIPIIMYHALSNEVTKDKYTLTAEKFYQQLSIIKKINKQGVSLSDHYKNPKINNVIITFDDGHISNLDVAIPILKEFGYTATFFITTDRVGKEKEWLRWDDISIMIENDMDIQAHGHTHAFLDTNSHPLLENELRLPRERFNEMLRINVNHFSLPGGRYCKQTINVAKNIGYLTISTSEPGLNNIKINNKFTILHRFVVHQGIDHNQFKKIVEANIIYSRLAKFKYIIKKYGKNVLGNNLYQKLWNIVMK